MAASASISGLATSRRCCLRCPIRQPVWWTPGIWTVSPLPRTQRCGTRISSKISPARPPRCHPLDLYLRRFRATGLIAASFAMKKVKGHGKSGRCWRVFGRQVPQQSIAPWYARPGREGEVLIIGGGIASAMTALSLVERVGTSPCCAKMANRPAAPPAIDKEPLPRSTASTMPCRASIRWPLALPETGCWPWRSTTPSPSPLCGVTQLGYDDKSAAKLAKMSQGTLPPELMHPLGSGG